MKLLLLTLLSLLTLASAFALPNPLTAALKLATRDPHSTTTTDEYGHEAEKREVHKRKWRKCKYNCNNYYHNNNNHHHPNAGAVVGPSLGMGVGVVAVGVVGAWVGV